MSFTEGWIDCGCCAGIEWGGEYPRECRSCGGKGYMYRYASGRLALWRGGPFAGQDDANYPHTPFDLDVAMREGATA